MHIRTACLDDIGAISELIVRSIDYYHTDHYSTQALQIWRRGYTPSKLKEHLVSRLCLILEEADQLAGVVQFQDPEVKGFYVDPQFKGRGFGRQLMTHLSENLIQQGYQQIELTSNEWAVGFYEKCGFEMVGPELVYWENYPFEEYRMIKNLTEC